MYVILSYDVNAERTQIFKIMAGRFLHHTHNSVFEGHITESQLMKLQSGIEEELKDNESLIIWILQQESYVKKIVLGNKQEFNFL
jgi:CRISPR-associated protein Cas2